MQDLIKKTVVANENTLLAELKVKVRLYEDDYVDFSTYLEFQSLIGGLTSDGLSMNDGTEGSLKLEQELSIMSDKYMERISSRQCQLQATLNL